MTTEHVDLVVVGLGPAGASAAAEAARRGCKVVAIDRKREPGRPVQCAEFVPAMIGAETGDLAASVRQPIDAMVTFVEDDAPDVKEHFPGYMLDRAAFDAALVAAAEQAGARCAFGAGVRSVRPDGRVELADGRVIIAKVVVGADGPRSIVGRAIGQINRQLVETRQITVPLRQPHQATDIFLSADIPGGYGWLFPKGDVANLGAGVDPAHKARLKNIVAGLHASLVARRPRRPGDPRDDRWPDPGGRHAAAVGNARRHAGAARRRCRRPGQPGDRRRHSGGGAFGQARGRGGGQPCLGHTRRPAPTTRKRSKACSRRRWIARCAAERSLPLLAGTGALPDKAALRRGWIAYPQYWAA